KVRALCREERPLELGQLIQRERSQRYDARILDPLAATSTFVAHVAPGQFEAGLAVVVLLRRHAVEPHRAAGQALHAGAPQRAAVASPAMLRMHDVEAEKAEALVVTHHRDRRHRLVTDAPDKKTLGVGC